MGYDSDLFTSEVKEDLKCMICLDVLEDPYECKNCQTSFCNFCITDWSKKKNTCPNNCELVLQKSHKFLRSELDKLQLFCKNKQQGCEVIIRLEQIISHEGSCEFSLANCRFSECDFKILRKDVLEHEKFCDFREVLCESCDSLRVFNKPHSCTEKLGKILTDLDKKIHDFSDSLNEISHKFISTNRLHFGQKCRVCGTDPIRGQWFACSSCKDYSECWECNSKSQHVHKNFVCFNGRAVHEYVLCDDCGVYPVKGMRYKCKDCDNFDLCQGCYLENRHEHREFHVLKPICISVNELKCGRMNYRRGEELVRGWEIYNLGDEDLDNLAIFCAAGDPCTNSPYYSLQGIVIKPKCHREIYIRDVITQDKPGFYKAEWRFEQPSRLGSFGPFLYYELFIM